MSYSEHPVLCQNVAVSSDNTWKQTRKIYKTLMSSSRMKRMSTKVMDDIQALMNVLDKHVSNGGTGGLRKPMKSFIMYLMIDCFQSQDTGFPSDKPLNKSVGYVMEAIDASPLLARLRILLPKFLLRLFGISFITPNGLAKRYINVIDDLIERRLATDAAAGVEQQNDFLQDLLSFMSESKKTEDRQQTVLTHDEVVGNLYGGLLDGFNIMVEIIDQAIYELARDQQSQRRLYDELAKQYALSSSSSNVAATAADSDQHIITYDMSVKVKYLEAVINESLRLTPNDLRESRIAAEDYRLADTGITVRRGQQIEFPMYPIHLNPDYFPEPDRFDPDRFMGQNRDKIKPYTFLPFGTGPRACAGQPFVWLIVKLILANLFYRYHIYLIYNTSLFPNPGAVAKKIYYLTRNFDYWSKLGVNGPKPVIGYGNILFRLSKNVNKIDFQWSKKYGKAFGVYKYNAPVVTITDPELIKRVCVTDFRYFNNRGRDPVMSYSEHPVLCQNVAVSDDNTWKQTRKIYKTLMSSSRMKRMSTKVTDDIQVLMNVLDKQVSDSGGTITETFGGLRKTMKSFIMYLMIDCFQSQDTGFPSDKPLNKSVGYVMEAIDASTLLARLRVLLPKFLLRLFGISFMIPNGLANSYVNIIDELIGRRLAADEAAGVEQQNDFLEDLLSFMSEFKKTEDRQQTVLTHDEVVGNLYGGLLDGYNIMVEVIGQAIYELARDQQSQRRLYDELAKQYALSSSSSNVAADSDQHIITYDMSVKVKYLEAVINESLRLTPNDLRDSRIAAEDYRLADTGITVRRGQLIEFPMSPIHMNPDYFPEPDRFDPDRFMGQNRDKIKPYTFLPFGNYNKFENFAITPMIDINGTFLNLFECVSHEDSSLDIQEIMFTESLNVEMTCNGMIVEQYDDLVFDALLGEIYYHEVGVITSGPCAGTQLKGWAIFLPQTPGQCVDKPMTSSRPLFERWQLSGNCQTKCNGQSALAYQPGIKP
ncbi:uncharacterized protein LOC128956114 [Oppia nitens]|uniref:uncharacterized protein LOC128956114 n=1 Tax=Oppia nitens TaxID=1686743 RepID=UPI0023DBBC73|nr:uncharacterized protein LOC128956114 [Oppia nitens]